MPHKFYHGRTGRVFNVTPHAVGVIVNRGVDGRIEHVVRSRCREEFLKRVKANDAAKVAAKAEGKEKPSTKRSPKMPHDGYIVEAEVLTRAPVPYDPIY